eukprot:6090-Karenia_brevis.AAC.2
MLTSREDWWKSRGAWSMFLHGACRVCFGDFGYDASRVAAGVICQPVGGDGVTNPGGVNLCHVVVVGSELMDAGHAVSLSYAKVKGCAVVAHAREPTGCDETLYTGWRAVELDQRDGRGFTSVAELVYLRNLRSCPG